jgi:hypothetical protein
MKNRFLGSSRTSAPASLFQPQIGALAGKPVHPLLGEFVRCARDYAGQAVAGTASSSASS